MAIRRKSKTFVVKATSAGKDKLVINAKDSKKILDYAKTNFGEPENVQLRTRRSTFPVSERKTFGKKGFEGSRISIPSSVVKKRKLNKGRLRITVVSTERSDRITSRRKFNIARNRTVFNRRYFWQELDKVDQRRLVFEIMKDVAKQKGMFIYIRLIFLFQDDSGKVFVFGRTLTTFERLDFVEDRRGTALKVKFFVEEAFEDALRISMQPYITDAFFVRYEVASVNLLREKVRVRDI